MKTPTEGSIPALLAPLPKPRMMKLVLALDWSWPTRRLGTEVCRSIRSRICALRRSAAEATETATGVSCNVCDRFEAVTMIRSEEHKSELQSLMRISYAVFCWTKKITQLIQETTISFITYKLTADQHKND